MNSSSRRCRHERTEGIALAVLGFSLGPGRLLHSRLGRGRSRSRVRSVSAAAPRPGAAGLARRPPRGVRAMTRESLVDALDLTDDRLRVEWHRPIRFQRCRSVWPAYVVELGPRWTVVDVPTLFGVTRFKARTRDLWFIISREPVYGRESFCRRSTVPMGARGNQPDDRNGSDSPSSSGVGGGVSLPGHADGSRGAGRSSPGGRVVSGPLGSRVSRVSRTA